MHQQVDTEEAKDRMLQHDWAVLSELEYVLRLCLLELRGNAPHSQIGVSKHAWLLHHDTCCKHPLQLRFGCINHVLLAEGTYQEYSEAVLPDCRVPQGFYVAM